MMERSTTKSVDSSLSLSEISSTEEEEKLQQEEGSSSSGLEGSGSGADDGRAAAAAAAVAAAVQQQQERQLQQQLLPSLGETTSLQNALEQQQQEEQKLYLPQLESRQSLRWRRKSVGNDFSASSSSSSSHKYPSSDPPSAAEPWRMFPETPTERGDGKRGRRQDLSGSSSQRRRREELQAIASNTVAPSSTEAAAHPPDRQRSARTAAAKVLGDSAARTAAPGPAAAAVGSPPGAHPLSPVERESFRKRSGAGVGWAAEGEQQQRDSRGGRQQQQQQIEACFDDVIVRPFEKQDAAAVRRLCYRHFRSLTLPSVFFWICHHSVDAAALFCISLCFLPLRGVLLSAMCFFAYLLLRGVYEFELYIKRDCPDLADIYESYMRTRASGFWVAERLERSTMQAAAAAASAAATGDARDSCVCSSSPLPPKRRIVGCIGLAPLQADKKTAQLVRLVVDRSQRRQHIGTLLLNTLIAYALQQHYSIIRLYTNNLNSDSIRFAKTKGFELQQIVRRGLMRGDLLKWQKKLELPGATVTQRKTRSSRLVSSVLD